MTRSAADIQDALTRFDGVRVAVLQKVLAADLQPEAEEELLARLDGPDQIGATWLVKALAEAGRLSDARMAAVFASLPELTEPDAVLHLLQTVQHAPHAARPHRQVLLRFAAARKLLVRVWAFDAYCRLAEGDAERADARERIARALTDRSKAMQARARALARVFGMEDADRS
ncbi:hypothetical protein E2K80_18260 [Rhodophyticola sp. CCM32]|uniref:hypothetical protein n=1 Tax=Rhodophyticola sp. CCM32 TaxID=2916397 RepID=UPI00107EFF59|nr:hypothetical protein [Rhodophyticola sp. CCM32]QBY02446.1 hypothetical protein E2K80_18260 [Rhodophyticola sp. CCM32]